MSSPGYINNEGHIVLPEEIREKYGIKPGSRIKFEEARDRIIIHRPVNHLAKVYIEPRPAVFFGGIGEPLFHPEIVDMIQGVKELGAPVELITNGTLLSEDMIRQLVETGLDMLWVSIDGAAPESYADIRLGNELPYIKNLRGLKLLKFHKGLTKPEMGLSIVIMKRNIAEITEVIKMGYQLGANEFSISNVLPYTLEYKDEVLYTRSI